MSTGQLATNEGTWTYLLQVAAGCFANAASAQDAAAGMLRELGIGTRTHLLFQVATGCLTSSVVGLLFFGHALADVPLERMGTNTGAGYNTRVLGYDGARGEFSMFATLCIFGPWLLVVPCLSEQGALAVLSTLALLGLWYRFRIHASHPGGPRAHRILREPQWANKTSHLDAGWRCEVAEASHMHTHTSLPIGQTLTGEAAGRQIWHKVQLNPLQRGLSFGAEHKEKCGFNPSVNPNPEDEIWRAQRVQAWTARGNKVPDARWVPKTTLDALRKALSWYEVLQSDDGHWAGDYGGPHFLMPGLIVVWYVTGRLDTFLDGNQRAAMAHYLRVHQQLDGGWGMHIESPSTMFGSVMCYVALRLLGTLAEDPAMQRGCEFIRSYGGALYTGSWAKFYLCLLGVMDWKGHNVIPPEMWLLPRWMPFHPGRLWCHCRMVYLPMCYLYGHKFVYADAESDPLIAALRAELYPVPYESIRWEGTADHVAEIDNYSPMHPVMHVANAVLRLWESCGGSLMRALRRRGLAFALDYMAAEDNQTNYVCIGPVNKVFCLLMVDGLLMAS